MPGAKTANASITTTDACENGTLTGLSVSFKPLHLSTAHRQRFFDPHPFAAFSIILCVRRRHSPPPAREYPAAGPHVIRVATVADTPVPARPTRSPQITGLALAARASEAGSWRQPRDPRSAA